MISFRHTSPHHDRNQGRHTQVGYFDHGRGGCEEALGNDTPAYGHHGASHYYNDDTNVPSQGLGRFHHVFRNVPSCHVFLCSVSVSKLAGLDPFFGGSNGDSSGETVRLGGIVWSDRGYSVHGARGGLEAQRQGGHHQKLKNERSSF